MDGGVSNQAGPIRRMRVLSHGEMPAKTCQNDETTFVGFVGLVFT